MGGILCLCGENTDKLLEREKRFPKVYARERIERIDLGNR